MGTDVYSESGIIATTDDVIGLLRKKDLKKVIEICMDESLEIGDLEPLKKINKKSSIEEVKNVLFECVKVHGKPSKYGNDDCYLENSYQLECLWDSILSDTRPELPSLKEINVFDSPRYNGWNVPLGEACFIFDSTNCFVQTLSEEGQVLKKAIGHCDESEWTIVSY
tara:strand:+ start:234 stop:734 length:501 start_codon:yes stop_codon:yes gene_type:complete